MLELLRRNRRYARLWGGESVSIFGDQVTALALPMIAIILLHAPAWQLGILTAASWTPYLFALMIGTLVDRIRIKRAVMMIADLARAACLATIPLAYLLDRMTMVQLFIVAAAVGLAGVISQSAYAGFFVRMIDADDFVAANSLNSTSRSVCGLGGPPAAGGLIQLVGAPAALLADCLSYLVSAATLARLKVHEPARERSSRRHVLREAVDGMRTLLHNPWLSSALWCTCTMNLASYAVLAIILLFATRDLHLSPAGIGTAQGIGAVGALLGALLCARLARRIGLYPVVLVGCLFFSLPYAVLALASGFASPTGNIALYAGCTFVVTGGIMLYDIMINSVMAKVMPDAMRGRLVGAFSSINYGIRPTGALIGGVLAETWGLRPTILAASCVGLLAVIPLLLSPLRHCRSMSDVPSAQPGVEVRAG